MVRVTKPAIVFHMPWGENIFHFLNDGLAGVFATLLQRNLLPLHLKILLLQAREARSDGPLVRSHCILSAALRPRCLLCTLELMQVASWRVTAISFRLASCRMTMHA